MTSQASYIAEFVGTFSLVFTVGCVTITGQPVWGGVAIACVLTVMIYALASISGANFNPAVSAALAFAGKLEVSEAITYACVQLVAAIFAGMLYTAMFDKTTSLTIPEGHTLVQAGLAEILYTFMLCFVVLNVAASKAHGGKNQFYGIAIGFVIVAGAYGAGNLSRGCFNPAVAFGLDISSGLMGVRYCLIYTIFELLGAAGAVALFFACRPEELAGDNASDQSPAGLPEDDIKPRLTSEFLGTFFLVLTVGLNVLNDSPAAVFSIACALMSMIFALGTVSGAHFNPAVTTAIVLSGRNKCSMSLACWYICSQCAGAITAAFTYTLMMDDKRFALKPADSQWSQVIGAECFFTFMLAFVVLCVATTKKPLSEYFGFAIGMCVTVGGCAIGKVSGGSLNPAVSIGIGSRATGEASDAALYAAVELAAGAIAAGVFRLTHESEYVDKKLDAGTYGAANA